MEILNYNQQRRADMRNNILVAAKQYFVAHGISGGVQMKEIAAAAGTSRQTLYSYFDNIDHIAFALARESALKIRDYVASNYRISTSPLQNISNIARSILKSGIDCQDDAVYLFLFDAYKHNNPAAELSESYEAIYSSNSIVSDLIKEGKQLGEIRADVDIKLAQSILTNIFLSLSMRLCVVTNSRDGMLSQGFDLFSDEVIKMLYSYLKA